MVSRWFIRLNIFACFLALVVIVLGAYTRLSDAGLGCPDWPSCYGHIGVPQMEHEIAKANLAFPDRPLEAGKAWKEMIHRYFASTLGLVILVMAILALIDSKRRNTSAIKLPLLLPLLLLGLVIFQGLLGMWTVTLLLKPLVVMGHLLGGLSIISLLFWQLLRISTVFQADLKNKSSILSLRAIAISALAMVVLQISLGGWTSANYAALSCPDFPTCQNQWWPDTNFQQAFVPWQSLKSHQKDYEGGVLDNDANVTIHMMHRVGAILTLLIIGLLFMKLRFKQPDILLQRLAWLVGLIVLLQLSLGISNVIFQLPLITAVSHNAGGVLLLLALVLVNHALRPQDRL